MAIQTEMTTGTFCWNERAVWDTEKAIAFYTALFGRHF